MFLFRKDNRVYIGILVNYKIFKIYGFKVGKDKLVL